MNKSLHGGALALAFGAVTAVQAAPVVINTPFMNLENRGINSLGFTPGARVRWGANAVTPNGLAGTTGVAIQAGTGTTRELFFNPSPLLPNIFSRVVPDSPSLRGDWTLKFTNGTDTASANVSLSPSATQAPFVQSITLSGTSLEPTFAWAPPSGATVNGYRVNIFDKSLITNSSGGQVASINVPPSITSHTVTAADFTVPGYAWQKNKNYSIEISLIQTKDGTGNLSNSNLQAIARSYADFTPNEGGGPPVNLPVVLENGAYQFNMAITAGQTYYIDPEVAVGYDYAIGEGNPNFATLDLPDNIGDGLYDIFGFDAGGNLLLLADDWDGRQVFSFATGGVSRFRVTGIETSAGLDPANTTAFITGVSFTGSGQFTGTQTPLTVNVTVPEPSALALAGLALAGLVATRRRKH